MLYRQHLLTNSTENTIVRKTPSTPEPCSSQIKQYFEKAFDGAAIYIKLNGKQSLSILFKLKAIPFPPDEGVNFIPIRRNIWPKRRDRSRGIFRLA